MASRSFSNSLNQPLVQHLFPARGSFLRHLLHVAFGIAVISLLAQVRFEIGPVPITGQTLGVLLIAAAYGATMGGITLISYLVAGGLGLSVFAGGSSGWAVLQGTTAGYLFGFVIAAVLVGFLAQRGWDRTVLGTAAAMLIGNLVIYASGLIWLNQFAPNWATTLEWGLTPFIVGDIIKLAFAAALLPAVWSMIGKRNKR